MQQCLSEISTLQKHLRETTLELEAEKSRVDVERKLMSSVWDENNPDCQVLLSTKLGVATNHPSFAPLTSHRKCNLILIIQPNDFQFDLKTRGNHLNIQPVGSDISTSISILDMAHNWANNLRKSVLVPI